MFSKNSLPLLFILCSIFTIYSCNHESNDLIDIHESQDYSFKDVDIDERHSVYLGVTPWGCSTVRVWMNPICSDDWKYGLIDAASLYNSTNTGLHIIRTNNMAEADIVINCGTIPGTTTSIARSTQPTIANLSAVPPVSQTFGGVITIAPTPEDCRANDPCWFMFVITHELGHTFGLQHNDANNFQAPNWIPGSDRGGNDQGSMFNRGTSRIITCDHTALDSFLGYGDAPCEFSEQDEIALEWLFPRPANPCVTCPNSVHPLDCMGTGPVIVSECPCPIGYRCVGGFNCVEL